MVVSKRKIAGCTAALLIAGSSLVSMAQDKGEALNPGSLAALTAEVQKLRLAVEESTRSQAQTQAIGVYLSVQQSRLVQVTTRLDAVRKELDDITRRSRQTTAELARISQRLLSQADPQMRSEWEGLGRALKDELERMGLQEQQVRSREAELSQLLQTENNRWTDLISALERIIKK
jgi:hypothetical protein